MKVYRLTKAKYADELSGIGAAKFGNRWNSKGVEMIYTAGFRALAVTEILVHLPIGLIPEDMMMLQIDIPANLSIEVLDTKVLPSDWDVFPPRVETQGLGDAFVFTNEFAVLKVPSAVVQGDFNFLLNPNHPDFKNIKILSKESFGFDMRLF